MANNSQFKPRLRIDAKYDLQAAFNNLLGNLIEQTDPIYKSCINCDHFDEPKENCRLFKSRPPARVICFGCPKWEDKDEIPF